METVVLFLAAAFIAYHASRLTADRLTKRRREVRHRTQVQIGGDGSTQVQVGRDLAVTVNPPNPASPRPPQPDGQRLPPSRNGGPFATITTCPACGTYALHPMRLANLEEPDRLDLRYASGGIARTVTDRWNETPYEIVRSCADHDCGWEWGHPAPAAAIPEETP